MFSRELWYGNFGLDVRLLQQFLNRNGFGSFVCTGFYGEKTIKAVQALQRKYNISPDKGYFGTKTRAKVLELISDENRESIYKVAKSFIGLDVTPDDIVPDEYDCSDTVCTLLKKAGFNVGDFPLTTRLYEYLLNSKEWNVVNEYKRGDVIISPTGYGNGNISNGHVGIISDNGKIMSNSSVDGILRENYTIDSWNYRYKNKGGFPVVYFRKL